MTRLAIFRLTRQPSREDDFQRLFLEMYPRLVRYATQLMPAGEDARDVVSEVMEQAWKEFDRLTVPTRPAWLYTATRNACLNHLKHLDVERHYLEQLAATTQEDVDNGFERHEALLCEAERIARELPEPTRTILRLCYWEKRTYKEVAERLGISPDTVKKHISKALQTLRVTMRNKED